MVDYGTDIRIGTVVSTQSGIKNLIEAILWRLQTPRGSLFYDTSYGEDVREYLQSELTPATLQEMQGLIKAQCQADDRVANADVKVSTIPGQFKLMIEIKILTELADSFSLVISVDKLTVELLNSTVTL